MSIGSTVNTNEVTIGVAVSTLNKLSDGKYSYVEPTSEIPTILTLKAANPSALQKRITLSLSKNPGLKDSYPDTRAGRMSCSVNMNATTGSVVTAEVAQDFLSELGSLLCQPAITSALLSGSYE